MLSHRHTQCCSMSTCFRKGAERVVLMSRAFINLQLRPTFPVLLLFLPGSGTLKSALRFLISSFPCNSSYKLQSLLRQKMYTDVAFLCAGFLLTLLGQVNRHRHRGKCILVLGEMRLSPWNSLAVLTESLNRVGVTNWWRLLGLHRWATS